MTSSETSPRADRACGHGDDRPGDDRPGDDRPGGDRLADELRAVALLALDRLDPLLARVRDAVQPSAGAPSTDVPPPSDAAPAPCPLCLALATLRGERPEPARRLAEHTAGLLAALHDALAEPAPSAPRPMPRSASARPARPVQRIPVDRGPGAAPC